MNIFKISLPGSDVKNSKLNEEVADSLYPSPKVSTLAKPPHAGLIHVNWSSSIVVPAATTKLIYRFAHNYDYIPTVFGIHSYDNGSRKTNGILPLNVGAIGLIILDADDTYINLSWLSTDISGVTPVPPFVMQVRFYVMAERGHE